MELALRACTVRSWRTGDVPSLVRNADNRAVWRNLLDGFPSPYTQADAEHWIRHASSARPETHFAIAVLDHAVGGIGFTPLEDVHRRSARIGYWLGEPYWGRGIATEALTAVTAFVFENFDLERLEATVFEWNPASSRVLEKAGYTLEGRLRRSVTKDGQTIDCFLYALVRP